MNNKGFAITTMLYGVLILFLMLLMSMLGILNTYKDRIEILTEKNNGTRELISINNSEYSDSLENGSGETDEDVELYTIKYDVNGGEGVISSQTKIYGVTLNLSDTMPYKEGYTFLGWDTSSDATTVVYKSGWEFTINADMTLYAVYVEFDPLNFYKCDNISLGDDGTYAFTYTGDCEVIDDGYGDWRIKFLTSGDLEISADLPIDVFLVGGGGGGGNASKNGAEIKNIKMNADGTPVMDSDGNYVFDDVSTIKYHGGSGGGGGYTKTESTTITAGNTYTITIGDGGVPCVVAADNSNVYDCTTDEDVSQVWCISCDTGGTTTAFGFSANGGGAGGSITTNSLIGGIGGNNGGFYTIVDYDNNDLIIYDGSSDGQYGQGYTTREFGDEEGILYAGGGGAGGGVIKENDVLSFSANGKGGLRGGGDGAAADGDSLNGTAGVSNTGGGGGGGATNSSEEGTGGKGGSGIVVIRISRFRQHVRVGETIECGYGESVEECLEDESSE